MHTDEFIINFYDLKNGIKPAEIFITDLPPKMQAKVLRSIGMLKVNGSYLREPYSKHLEDGIFEVRSQIGSDITRVLYFFMDGKRIILTHGFVKKTQKTPTSEIERAKRYREEYFNRKEHNDE